MTHLVIMVIMIPSNTTQHNSDTIPSHHIYLGVPVKAVFRVRQRVGQRAARHFLKHQTGVARHLDHGHAHEQLHVGVANAGEPLEGSCGRFGNLVVKINPEIDEWLNG